MNPGFYWILVDTLFAVWPYYVVRESCMYLCILILIRKMEIGTLATF